MPTKAGRPLKLTKPVTERICDAISIGTPLTAAARYGGISYRTFLNWYQAGQTEFERLEEAEAQAKKADPDPDQKKYLQFFHQVEEAKANGMISWANVLNNAARVDPKWAAYMLEKWDSQTYGQQAQRLEVTGKGGGPIQTEDVGLTDEERINKLITIFERARQARNRSPDRGD
jgi:hypothetical protein